MRVVERYIHLTTQAVALASEHYCLTNSTGAGLKRNGGRINTAKLVTNHRTSKYGTKTRPKPVASKRRFSRKFGVVPNLYSVLFPAHSTKETSHEVRGPTTKDSSSIRSSVAWISACDDDGKRN